MSRTSCTMDGFCLLYLPLILLMRSGDVETNPGPDRIVSEEEFIKLSKLIKPSYYKEVGVNLEIPNAELGQIRERSLNTSDALITVFTRWREKQLPGTDIRALLAGGLERSDLEYLSGRLLAGSLVPKQTGSPITMPGSQTQPLSPDLIKRCADDFIFKYRTTLCKIRADPLDPDSIMQFDNIKSSSATLQPRVNSAEPSGSSSERGDIDIVSEYMAPCSIFMTMLYHMWKERRQKFMSFQTFKMFEFLKVHYVQKEIADLGSPSFKAYPSQIENLVEPVAKVAFIGLQEIIIIEDDFVQCSDSMETACKVGALSPEKKLSSRKDKSSSYVQSFLFPHKLFEDYIAGIYLASLYERDHNEFDRLIEQVVLPRKEEFRHLLDFTVSRNKTIANHVMKCMVQGNTPNRREMDFLVDVSFESQDLDTAALVRIGRPSVTIDYITTAHNMAGYVFTGLLKDLEIPELEHVRCSTSASSDNLAESLCSMPNLTDLTLHGKEFKEEFYSTLNVKASTFQVEFFELEHVRCSTSASSDDLAEALCSMPNLTDLTLNGKEFKEEFYSTLNAKASTLQDVLLGLSFMYLSSGLSFCRMRSTCCTMGGFCHLYLLMILLMRSGDVETNPGPDRIVSEDEIVKLSKLIKPRYYTRLGVHLKISIADLGQIRERSLNTSDALITVFTRWRDKQLPGTDIRALLSEGLERIDLEYLSGRLLAGSLVPKQTDKTTSFPSPPNIITSTPTTAAATTTTTQKAFLLITLLTWAAVMVSGITPELSTTTGDTVNIPCLFGEGMLLNIYWYYSGSTGRHKILSLAEGELTITAEYANRASLQDDDSTLILKEITVADEGTYRCDVDRQGQTVVPNINTKLNVFSLRPDTLPVISPCTGADRSSSCSIHASQSFTLTCTLPNVYHVKDTKLIWYQDGQRVSSIHDDTQNDDGTTDISRQIHMSETGNLTCNATYHSANGRENTAASVEAWIIPPADVPNTTRGKNMTSGQIAGMTIGIVLCVGIILWIITFLLYHSKARGQGSSRKHKDKLDQTQPDQDELILLGTSAEKDSKDGNGESSEPIERPTQNRFNHEEDGKEVHWDFLTDCPQELTLQDDEKVISCGIRFLPPAIGAKLSKPIKVTLDHNAHFSDPKLAEIVFYTRNKDSTTFVRIPASTNGYPRCHIRAKDFDFYVNRFSPWWIVAVINKYFVGKRVNCTPYVRQPVKKGFAHLVLLCINDDQLDVIQKTNEKMKEYRKLCPPQQMVLQWRCGDINIEVFDGPKGNKEKIDEMISERDINFIGTKLFSFEVKPLESGASQKFLTFTLDQKGSTSYPTLIPFIFSYDEELQGASTSQTDETLVISGRQEDFDEKLRVVARNVVKPGDIDDLGRALGFKREDI